MLLCPLFYYETVLLVPFLTFLLRHFTVGPSKTSDISSDIDYNVKNGLEPVQEGGEVISNTQYRIATAIYPSASMMNHSW